MEDLAPLLIFVVIAIINIVKFFAEKNAKNKPAAAPQKTAPKRMATSLEDFFEELAGKMNPQPPVAPQPDWPPEEIVPANYMEELEEDEYIAPEPAATFPPAVLQPMQAPIFQSLKKTVAYRPQAQVSSSAFAGTGGMRLQPMPIMRTGNAGTIHIDLRERKKLKQAILASLIFSPPRACDNTFDTTIAK